MKLHIENRIKAGYVIVFVLLALSYASFFMATQKLDEKSDAIEETNKIINKLEVLFSYVKDAEIGVRGYIGMKDDQFLDIYKISVAQYEGEFRELRNLLKDNKFQQSRAEILKDRINEEYRILNSAVVIFRENGMVMNDSIRAMAYHGKEVMDRIRSLVKVMEDAQNDQLKERTDEMQRLQKALNIIILTSIIIAVVLVIYSFLIYVRENKLKMEADAKADEYRHELEKRVEELNAANKALKELKSIEKFAASGRIARQMAHEIRNPLTNIGLASEQLRSELADKEDLMIFFDMIDRNAKRINQLVSDLLNSTKFAQLQVENIAISDLIDEVLQDANDRIELKTIKLVKEYQPDICRVSVDKERMKIALLNIIVNAIEAMEEGKGVLTIGTAEINGKCCITIKDNGSGISRDALGKLFEPYFTGKPKGTGLGLTATQNIVLNHKGSIDVESEEGKGSTFIITLNFSDDC